MTPDLDADVPPDRATALRAAVAVVLGAAAVAAADIVTFQLRSERFGWEPARCVTPALVFIACLWICARARRDGDGDALLGALALAALAVLGVVAKQFEWLPRFPGPDPDDLSDSGYRIQPGSGWNLPGAPVGPLVAICTLACAVASARALRIPWHGMLRPGRPVLPGLVLATLSAVLLFPVIAIAMNAHGIAIEWSMHHSRPHVSIRDAIRGLDPASVVGDDVLGVGLSLSVLFPSLEMLFHGSLRRAFAGAPPTRFVVAGAVAAAFVLPTVIPLPQVFMGCLVTGVLAVRTQSVVPGIVFWQALAASPVIWRALVP